MSANKGTIQNREVRRLQSGLDIDLIIAECVKNQ